MKRPEPGQPIKVAIADDHALFRAGVKTALAVKKDVDLIAEADWLIDLGPEGGEAGGEIVAEGTPEQVAQNKRSHTGRFLREFLAGK